MTTIEKFTDLCYLISSKNGKFSFWWPYLDIYKCDDDYTILKQKIINFLEKLNENSTDWFEKDVEKEIFYLL